MILQFDPELSLLIKTPVPVSCQEDLKNIMSHFEIQVFLCSSLALVPSYYYWSDANFIVSPLILRYSISKNRSRSIVKATFLYVFFK